MASSGLQNLTFDEPNGSGIASEAFSSTSGRVDRLMDVVAPKLMAMGGLALFAGALAVAFRVITLDAASQLQQPAIDFAICGAVGFLGLSVSWMHLGNTQRKEVENGVEESVEVAWTPAAASSAPRLQPSAQRFPAGRSCPFCGRKMMSLGRARYQCSTCRHLEGHGPVSFLDTNPSCDCAHCGPSA